jgi:uncharacterized protein YegL
MKKVLLVFGLVCSTLFAKAQEVAKVGIKNADYDALKKIAVKNPDKDTYIKEELTYWITVTHHTSSNSQMEKSVVYIYTKS